MSGGTKARQSAVGAAKPGSIAMLAEFRALLDNEEGLDKPPEEMDISDQVACSGVLMTVVGRYYNRP